MFFYENYLRASGKLIGELNLVTSYFILISINEVYHVSQNPVFMIRFVYLGEHTSTLYHNKNNANTNTNLNIAITIIR